MGFFLHGDEGGDLRQRVRSSGSFSGKTENEVGGNRPESRRGRNLLKGLRGAVCGACKKSIAKLDKHSGRGVV